MQATVVNPLLSEKGT